MFESSPGRIVLVQRKEVGFVKSSRERKKPTQSLQLSDLFIKRIRQAKESLYKNIEVIKSGFTVMFDELLHSAFDIFQ